jgi:hypothetical protein
MQPFPSIDVLIAADYNFNHRGGVGVNHISTLIDLAARPSPFCTLASRHARPIPSTRFIFKFMYACMYVVRYHTFN